MNDHHQWRETGTRLVKECHVFDLYESERISPRGQAGTFYLLKSRDWVNIVPLLTDPQGRECFVMVKQYRHGLGALTVEFPAGLVEVGEPPERAAGRELLEETGFRAASLRRIGKISPNPAIMSNWCYTYLAQGLEKTAPPKLDELEHLEMLLVPIEEVMARSGSDGYINAMTIIALQWYLRWREAGSTGADRIRTGA